MSCAKFGVVVFKAYMLDGRGILTIGIYILFYIYISAISCAKFGVAWYSRHPCLIGGGRHWP